MDKPTFNPIEALEAILARINGVYDNPELMKLGALSTDKTDDIRYIIQCTPAMQGAII